MENEKFFMNEVENVNMMIQASIAIRDILDELPINKMKLPILANMIHEYAEAEGFNVAETFRNMADCAELITESEGI